MTLTRKECFKRLKKVGISKEVVQCVKTLLMFGAFLGVCMSFYSIYEGWTIGTSLTFTIVAMSSVGYGYYYPSDDNSRLFTVFVMIFGIFGVYGAINQVVATRLAALNQRAHKKEADLDSAEIYKRHHRRLMLNVFGILGSLFVAAGVFSLIEDWTFARGLYFAVQTATTVGFGDIPIQKDVTTKLIGLYIILSTILLTFAFNNFQTLNADFDRLKEAAEFAKRKKTLNKIKELDRGQGVPLDSFLLAVMEQLGVLDRERDLGPWIKKFKEIDADGSGFIDAAEIEAFSDQEMALAAAQLDKLKHSNNDPLMQLPLGATLTKSFTTMLGLGFTELPDLDTPSNDGDSSDSDSDDEDKGEHEGEKEEVHKGEHLSAGGFRYLLFGGAENTRRIDHAHHHHHHVHHHLHHRHTGDMMPADMRGESMTLSMEDEDLLDLDTVSGDDNNV